MKTRLGLAGMLLLLLGCGGGSADTRQAAAVIGWVMGLRGTVSVEGRTLEIKTLADLPAGELVIQKINLNEKPVTDGDLENLIGLTALDSLSLHGSQVSDDGLNYLVSIKNLKELELSKTNVTDAGLKTLAELKSLEKLHLHNTLVTNEGIQEFRAAVPGCQVFPARK